jgi:hypothetical protein
MKLWRSVQRAGSVLRGTLKPDGSLMHSIRLLLSARELLVVAPVGTRGSLALGGTLIAHSSLVFVGAVAACPCRFEGPLFQSVPSFYFE